MIKTRFIFAVSMFAMLVVGSAWANAPVSEEDLGTAHTVYVDQTPTSGAGIAGVSYVNKAVNVAGASAQAAEAHAAAAGQSALNAASSAADAANSATAANSALASKQNVINADNKLSAAYVSGLAAVATSGSYNDLGDKPTIPTVNNATLTIQKNGTAVGTFTANASANKSIDIVVPTKVSELTNDSSYATTTAVNAKVTTAQGSSNANKAVITNSSGNITTGTITSGMIANGEVKTANIADLAVTTGKLAADAVTNAKLADNAVQTENIKDGEVKTADIADLAVTTGKLANNAVTVAKTTGIYGYIPTASDGTGSAQIWVE